MEAQGPDPESLGGLLEGFRPRLRRMITLRLDPRLRRRVDSSDVLQEAFVDVTKRVDEYHADPQMPFFLWVRRMTAQKLMEFHRRHLGAEMRDVRREVLGLTYPGATSASLARALIDSKASPSRIAEEEEEIERLRAALDDMEPDSQEILMLRYFERLTMQECAQALGLSLSGAKLRHLKAARHLKHVLDGRGLPFPGGLATRENHE